MVIQVFWFAVVAVIVFRFPGFSIDSDSLYAFGLFSVAVNGYQNAVHFYISGSYLERKGHLRSE